jgi:hypothetical protein
VRFRKQAQETATSDAVQDGVWMSADELDREVRGLREQQIYRLALSGYRSGCSIESTERSMSSSGQWRWSGCGRWNWRMSATGARLNHGYSLKGRKNSRSSIKRQKPCWEMLVTSGGAVVVRGMGEIVVPVRSDVLSAVRGAKWCLDGCIGAAERSDRRGSIDPIELVINAQVDQEYATVQWMRRTSLVSPGERAPW